MPWSSWLETASRTVSAGKEVSSMRTYKAFVLVPTTVLFEAKDDEDALKKVADVYKGYYTNQFPDWIEPLLQPEDVT
jgi:hypothetical protein